jgi:UDP-2,4-diacetamido-2,4,6-trideoxy-beta-L-altropyranose hydrolase
MRCLALAQAWQTRGGTVIFVMTQSTNAIDQCLRDDGVKVIHVSETSGSAGDGNRLAEIAAMQGADWIVIDGYKFDETYQLAIKQAGFKLMFMDDHGKCGHYFADVVLNHNFTASREMYARREPYTTLLLGTKFVMLRREFEPWREWQRTFPVAAKRILVTMGGSDPEALTLPLVKALAKICQRDLRVTVVVGGSNPRTAELRRAAEEFEAQIQLLTDVRDMAHVMSECDVAVVCGGGTLWELLYMGTATLTYSRPGVQQEIIEKLSSAGAVVDLGPAEDFDEVRLREAAERLISSPELRKSMSRQGRKLIDGQGSDRVLRTLSGTDSMNFATAISSDIRK